MNRPYIDLIVFSVGLIGLIVAGFSINRNIISEEGIYPSPSGTAVYLDGEACVINADACVTDDEFVRNLEFCWFEHTGYSLWAYEPPIHLCQ